MATEPGRITQLLNSSIQPFIRNAWDVAESVPVSEAAVYLAKATPPVLLVTKVNSKRVIGIIEPADLDRAASNSTAARTAGDVATRTLVGLAADSTVKQALEVMDGANSLQRRFDMLPVLSRNNEPLGLVQRCELEARLREAQGARESANELSF